MTTSSAVARDRGSTLVELLVALIVTAVVIVGVGGVMRLTYGTLEVSSEHAARSRNSQRVTLWLTRDVRGAGSGAVDIDTSGTLVAIGCGDSPLTGAEQVLKIEAPDPEGGAAAVVAYRLEGTTLVRHACDPAGLSAVTVADRVLAATATAAGRAVELDLSTDVDEPLIVSVTRPGVVTP